MSEPVSMDEAVQAYKIIYMFLTVQMHGSRPDYAVHDLAHGRALQLLEKFVGEWVPSDPQSDSDDVDSTGEGRCDDR